MPIPVTMMKAEPLVMDGLRARRVVNLQSSPGLGKSALAYQIAEKLNLCVIDVRLSQCDPTDLQGFPFILDKHAKKVKAGYVPMNIFPVEGDPLPVNPKTGEKYRGWLLLLDEFNSAPLSVQAAAYKIVLDRAVGMHKLHKNLAIMTAGNLATDKAIVNTLSTAMQSRVLHLLIEACPKSWILWADTHDIDHRVKSFINFKPELLHKFDPNHTDLTFPCPRTWEFMSDVVKPWKTIEIEKLPILAGTVGEGTGREFHAYSQIYGQIPTIAEILNNPTHVSFGQEPSMHYALSGMIGHHANKSNIDKLIKFVQRLEIDFQVVTLRAILRKDRTLKKASKGIQEWLLRNSQELM